MAPSISICIPAYEMGGAGAHYLDQSFAVLAEQDHTDFEVVVSDQSKDDAVAKICSKWAENLDVVHVWNRNGKRQASANINYAMSHAKGDVFKILFQDDFLNGADALGQIHRGMQSGIRWLLCGSCVTRDGTVLERPMVPRLTEKLQFGKNTVSSPSVLAMHRDAAIEFDEALVWLMDVDIYKQLWEAHGDPVILERPLVVNRIHEGQVSASVSKSLRHSELRYVRKKFAKCTSLVGKLEYLRQRIKAF